MSHPRRYRAKLSDVMIRITRPISVAFDAANAHDASEWLHDYYDESASVKEAAMDAVADGACMVTAVSIEEVISDE